MKRRYAIVFGGVTTVVVVALAQPRRGPQEPQRPDEVAPVGALVSLHGPRSEFPEEAFVRVMNAAEFREMWGRHMGDDAAAARATRAYPEVDFERCMVVAYFRGESVNSDGERIESIDRVGGMLRIRFDSMQYQTFGAAPDGGRVECTPFGVWVLPRDEGPIVIEENVQGLIGRPPQWKERKRFDAAEGR